MPNQQPISTEPNMATGDTDTPTRWGIRMSHSGDIYPAPSRVEADAACVLINASIERHTTAGQSPAICVSTAPWPHTDAQWHDGIDDFYSLFTR